MTLVRGAASPAPTQVQKLSSKVTLACAKVQNWSSKMKAARAGVSTKTRNVTANARACGQVLKLSAKHIIAQAWRL